MGSDILMGRQGDDYRKKEQQAKAKFENLDLNNLIRDIYMSAISKASEDYIPEIDKTRKHFLSTSYTEEQAQERFNHYTDEIRIKNEEDDCYYRYIKNNFLREHPDATLEDLQDVIVSSLCSYLRSKSINHFNKLEYIDDLPQQIYESNKIHRQFMFFKKIAENQMNDNSNSRILELHNFEEYSKLISHHSFIDHLEPKLSNGTKNPTYYINLINTFIIQRSEEAKNIAYLEDNNEVCLDFIHGLDEMMRHTVLLAKGLNNYNRRKKELPPDNDLLALQNPINISKHNLEASIEYLKSFSTIIKFNISDGYYQIAIALKNYYSTLLENCVKTLKEWIYLDLEATPFNEQIIDLKKAIENSYKIEEIQLLIKSPSKRNRKQKTKDEKSYTQKQVAIAYFAMSKTITKENYKSILEKHTETSSDKILQKLIVKSSDLTSLTENKTADTKQLNNLKEAKRLLSGIKDQKASKVLDDYITTFTNKYDNFYN